MQTDRRQYLEAMANRVGYRAERDDTDEDLIRICRLRGLRIN